MLFIYCQPVSTRCPPDCSTLPDQAGSIGVQASSVRITAHDGSDLGRGLQTSLFEWPISMVGLHDM